MSKPKNVTVKLRYATLPFVSVIKREWIGFGSEAQALRLTRKEAATLLRRLRTWDGYRWDVRRAL